MPRIAFIFFVLCTTTVLQAQSVGIGTMIPDSSAALDVSSTTQGILVPRMTDIQRDAIAGPADGLLVYVTTDSSFYCYDGNAWVTLNERTYELMDADKDTKVMVEANPDEDIIHFEMGGAEYFRMDSGRLEVLNTGKSVFIGDGAGAKDDLTDNVNVAVGELALHNNTGGDANTAIGHTALEDNTSGHEQVALGYEALTKNTMGRWNTATGARSLIENLTGDHNTASGYRAMLSNSSGHYNVGIGSYALDGNSVGSYNTAIAYGADVAHSNLQNATAVGAHALVSQSNSLVLGSIAGANSATSSVNVGIGTSAPLKPLDVRDNGANWIAGIFGPGGTGDRVVTGNLNGAATIGAHNDDLSAWANLAINSEGGSVGIGTTMPSTTLDVDGQIRMRSGAAAGYIPVSDVDGVMAWTSPTAYTLGLQPLTQNTLQGWRLKSVTSNNYHGIGYKAVDLSWSSQPFPTVAPPASISPDYVHNGAAGNHSLATGLNTRAEAPYTTAMGLGTQAQAIVSTAIGIWNVGGGNAQSFQPTNPIFEIGIGTNELVRENAMTVLYNGAVGIGTTTPSYPLHVTRRFQPNPAGHDATPNHYLANNGVAVNGTGWTYSIGATFGIWSGVGFACSSDERIKNVVHVSDAQQDLHSLMNIEVTDYTYIDTLVRGNQIVKKVIAQQVREVLPNAVNQSRGFVPDIYTLAPAHNVKEDILQITLTDHQLVGGDVIKLITRSDEEIQATVTEVTDSSVNIKLNKTHRVEGNIFVFGKEVHDFLHVDYDAISMLNVSATQELARQSAEQQQLMKLQQQQLAEQEQRIARLEKLLSRNEEIAKAIGN